MHFDHVVQQRDGKTPLPAPRRIRLLWPVRLFFYCLKGSGSDAVTGRRRGIGELADHCLPGDLVGVEEFAVLEGRNSPEFGQEDCAGVDGPLHRIRVSLVSLCPTRCAPILEERRAGRQLEAVARSPSRLRKLWTGKPSSVRRAATLRRAAGKRSAGATIA